MENPTSVFTFIFVDEGGQVVSRVTVYQKMPPFSFLYIASPQKTNRKRQKESCTFQRDETYNIKDDIKLLSLIIFRLNCIWVRKGRGLRLHSLIRFFGRGANGVTRHQRWENSHFSNWLEVLLKVSSKVFPQGQGSSAVDKPKKCNSTVAKKYEKKKGFNFSSEI